MGKEVFILEIDASKNQSWQGTLEWVKGHRKESFRSMLELLRLIDSVVDEDAADADRAFTLEGSTAEWDRKTGG